MTENIHSASTKGLASEDAQIKQLEEALATAQTAREKIDALNALAWAWRDRLGQRGMECAQTAYELAQAEQYELGLAHSLVNQSLFLPNDSVRTMELASQALVLFERLEDRVGQCHAMSSLCSAHRLMDDFVQAIEMGQHGLALAQAIGDQETQADLLVNLGLAYKRSDNYDLAYTVYQQARVLYHAIGDRFREGLALTDLAIAHAAHGQYDLALSFVRECKDLEIDEPNAKGYAFLVRGQIYAGKKEFDRALPYLHQALQFANDHAEHKLLAQLTLQTIGQAYIEQHELDQAIRYLQQGLAITPKTQSNLIEYRLHEMLAQVYETQGNLEQALGHYKQFHRIKEKLFNDNNTSRRQALEIQHQTEIARREAEIYRLHNVELQQEIDERKRLQEELRQQAITDELTQVFNRRYFLQLARAELTRAIRLHHPIAVALIDLDHFKRVNDDYGHAAGDQAIIAMAKICQKNIRAIDVFARFGGDEFALLFPEIDGAMASQILQRIQRVLVDQPLNLGGRPIALTVSAGVASFESKTDSVDMLLARADQALYQAKEAGRNRVCALHE